MESVIKKSSEQYTVLYTSNQCIVSNKTEDAEENVRTSEKI